MRTTTINEPEKAKIVEKLTTSLFVSAECILEDELTQTSFELKHKQLDELTKLKVLTWHDPVDNPMLCLYSQGGGDKPWHGSFGKKIRDNSLNHTGADLLVVPGCNVYACMDGEVVRSEINSSMFGDLIVLKIKEVDLFKARRKKDFKLLYAKKGELSEGPKFSHSHNEFYLLYAHLKERKVKVGDIVECGDIIALSGTSGENGIAFTTKNPHVHFEVLNVATQRGLSNKCNPGIYIDYKDENTMTEEDKKYQEMVKNTSEYHKQ